MLHAFRSGTIINQADPNQPSKLQNAPDDTGTDKIGKEEWAFIPKNAIPYLIWYGKSDYCHVPTVDYRTFVFDAKVNGEWKTLLVGSMGFGGKALGSYSSSVFVLDITDPLNPSLLWEKALPDQTLTLSFPAVTKIGSNWYVIIGSGPNNPDGTSFASSTKVYFFNINDGTSAKEITIPLTGNIYAAVGDIMPVDVDFDYSDDAIYFGLYGTKSGDTWGMFYRIVVKNGLASASVSRAIDLETFKTPSYNAAPPVFAAPNFTLDEFGTLWVFFGTGRYLTQADKTISYNNYLIGFKDPCWKGSCSNTYSKNTLTDRTNITVTATVTEVKKMCVCDSSGCGPVDVVYDTTSENSVSEPTNGWYYQLTGESIISQPAVFGGNVDALSFVPPADICAYGGSSNLLALYYKTGAPNPRPAVLSRLVTSDTSGNVTVYSKISIGSGAPPFGNPFQITQGISSREYTKFIQVSAGAVLRVEQQVSPGYESRFISWIEK
jgi:type IV pilus assembly protein PilY1